MTNGAVAAAGASSAAAIAAAAIANAIKASGAIVKWSLAISLSFWTRQVTRLWFALKGGSFRPSTSI